VVPELAKKHASLHNGVSLAVLIADILRISGHKGLSPLDGLAVKRALVYIRASSFSGQY
jgi:hypothetical protein